MYEEKEQSRDNIIERGELRLGLCCGGASGVEGGVITLATSVYFYLLRFNTAQVTGGERDPGKDE